MARLRSEEGSKLYMVRIRLSRDTIGLLKSIVGGEQSGLSGAIRSIVEGWVRKGRPEKMRKIRGGPLDKRSV